VRLTSRAEAGKQRARMRAERDMRPSPARPPVRVQRAALAAIAIAVGVYGLAQGLVRLPAFDRWARERIAGELRSRVGEATVAPGVAVDPLFRVTFGPVTIPGASASEPLARIDRVAVRPSLSGLLRGRLEPASVRLYGVRLAPGRRGRALRALLDRRGRRAQLVSDARPANAAPLRAAPRSTFPAVHVRGLVVELPSGGRAVEIGPVDADLSASRGPAGASAFAMALRLPGDGRGELTAEDAGERWRVHLRLTRLGPSLVPAAWRDGAVTLTEGIVALELDADTDDGLSRIEARVHASGERLFVSGGARRGRAARALPGRGGGRRHLGRRGAPGRAARRRRLARRRPARGDGGGGAARLRGALQRGVPRRRRRLGGARGGAPACARSAP
jgi:hypothetical protein